MIILLNITIKYDFYLGKLYGGILVYYTGAM
jgi:hypothetical protein